MTQVLEACAMTPLNRLRGLADYDAESSQFAGHLFREYDWFLSQVSRSKGEVLDWISEKNNREEAFSHSDNFIANMYGLVSHIAEKNKYQRYLVI